MNKRDKALSLISLAMKAGRCASGEMISWRRMHQTIRKRNFGICVNFTEFQSIYTEIKIP